MRSNDRSGTELIMFTVNGLPVDCAAVEYPYDSSDYK